MNFTESGFLGYGIVMAARPLLGYGIVMAAMPRHLAVGDLTTEERPFIDEVSNKLNYQPN
jgi:hypothetical protein